ncbi:hypothetical protein VIBNIFTn2_120157 [Vibrio nigripulchritudo FTn2]|uniref:hypothetical protein n=1 Tax=Vibrio nigripulchritudo TaxID=28173 RepID=UPI0003B1E846|nr:hypothetical protein [Vibrio nigripulchritudo]CCN40175.1 hypothetical protein VIBNIFTn2_120157 [Vibrio nigripulchritudo FTn2]
MATSSSFIQINNDINEINKHLFAEIQNWTAISKYGGYESCFYKRDYPNIESAFGLNCLPIHLILRKYVTDNYAWIKHAYIVIGVEGGTLDDDIRKEIDKPDLSCPERGRLAYSYLKDVYHVWLNVHDVNGCEFILDITSSPGIFVLNKKYDPVLLSKSSKSAFFLEYIKESKSFIADHRKFVSDGIRKYGI